MRATRRRNRALTGLHRTRSCRLQQTAGATDVLNRALAGTAKSETVPARATAACTSAEISSGAVVSIVLSAVDVTATVAFMVGSTLDLNLHDVPPGCPTKARTTAPLFRG